MGGWVGGGLFVRVAPARPLAPRIATLDGVGIKLNGCLGRRDEICVPGFTRAGCKSESVSRQLIRSTKGMSQQARQINENAG